MPSTPNSNSDTNNASLSAVSDYSNATSSTTQHEDEDKAFWRNGYVPFNRISNRIPQIPTVPPGETNKYKKIREIACVGKRLSSDQVTEAQIFVRKEWERIYDNFLKLDSGSRFIMIDQNLIFMIYAHLVLNSEYKKTYEEFKLISLAFDKAIVKKRSEEKYNSLFQQKTYIKKAKQYLNHEIHQDDQTQIVSKKCEHIILLLDKIATLQQFDPDRHSYQEIENCTQMVSECYAAINLLCLTKVKEENMSVNDAVSFLNLIGAPIPKKLSEMILDRRKKIIAAMLFYYLTDPQFIEEKAANEKKSEFYSAKQLLNDSLFNKKLDIRDYSFISMEKYKESCMRLSHPNHVDTIPQWIKDQRSVSWSYQDNKKQLEAEKETLFQEIENLKKLLEIP